MVIPAVAPQPVLIPDAQLRIDQVPLAQGGNENILQTGNAQHLLTHINGANYNSNINRMNELMNCLSQTLHSNSVYRGKCESLIKQLFFDFARANLNDALRVVELPVYQRDSQLRPIVKKIQYLAKTRTGKFIHSLAKDFRTNKSASVTLVVTGSQLIIGGVFSLFFSSDDNLRTAGKTAIAVGSVMLATPFLHALWNSCKD